MTKKKNSLISIIPAFLLMGAAVGIQTKNILRDTVIGLIVGILVYFFLSYRNKIINNKKS
jgi:biopolymer transport protein ExbB/TolQ|tara:strand:+ start:210 stop:389 length:180 start_codon:yes stop_codon:yes gene_type:complete